MRTLRAVFVVHGLITLAGAVVLTVFPTAIPSAVGITLERQDYLLVYLVAAAELAVAVLSFGAARLTDLQALGLIVTTLVVLHLSSGILDMVYMGLTGANGTMIANTVLRFTVVVVFLVAWRLSRVHHTPGTKPVVDLVRVLGSYPASSSRSSLLLVVDANREDRQRRDDRQQAPVRVERKRCSEHHDQRAEVHRVSDKAVQPVDTSFWSASTLTLAPRVVVLDRPPACAMVSPTPTRTAPTMITGGGHRRPAEAIVQRADHDHGAHREDTRTTMMSFCKRPGLRAWARLHASAQRIRILESEVHTGYQSRGGEHGNERPALPVIECACG